jgi:hypothetical protein
MVGIMVNGNFFNYKGGIYTGDCLTNNFGGHAVAVVGYGVDSSTKIPFWIIKNR